jgi:hypothetical protein
MVLHFKVGPVHASGDASDEASPVGLH